jgi:hypothetical protein
MNETDLAKINESLGLPIDATEDQAVAAVAALQAETNHLRSQKYLGRQLSQETATGVDRRVAAGLSMEDAIAAQLAQESHDAIGH